MEPESPPASAVPPSSGPAERSRGAAPAETADPGPARPPLAPRARFARLLCGWLLLFLAMPGELDGDGSLLLAVLGVAVWGRATIRPLGARPWRGRALEWLANAIGGGSSMWWVWHVVPPGVVYIGAGMGLYFALGAELGRRWARRGSPVVAVVLAWVIGETARTVLAPPLGLPWFLLGHYAHHHLWLSGSARVWGVEGLTVLVAALGGSLGALAGERRRRPSATAPGLLLFGLAAALAVLTAPPAMRPGPRVLIVQPGLEQSQKNETPWLDIHEDLRRRTLDALDEAGAHGETPDVVAWGETMLQNSLLEPDLEEALGRGIDTAPWHDPMDAADVVAWREAEDRWVRGAILDAFPPGVSFLAGAIVWAPREGELRRLNAMVLYDEAGRRGPARAKRFLVPGAETMMGLERFGWVRGLTQAFMPYVPDLWPAEETGTLELVPRTGGDPWKLTATICFDNAFVEPYVEPVLRERVDFHLVVSNEAWYRDAFEMDQMLAFSRIAVLASGRAMVRVTNSGISGLLVADGTERARLVVGGRDRSVAGTLSVVVPVPADPDAGAPPYGYLRPWLRGLLLAGGLVAWLLAARGEAPP